MMRNGGAALNYFLHLGHIPSLLFTTNHDLIKVCKKLGIKIVKGIVARKPFTKVSSKTSQWKIGDR